MVLHGKSYLQLSSKMLYVSVGFLKYNWKISFNTNVYIYNIYTNIIYIICIYIIQMYICIYTLWKSTFLPNLHIYDVKL